jgi:glycosyltransferase involved in cell wall biosynthesis
LNPSRARHSRRRLCLVVHAYYEEDARVRRQAEALVARGWEVEVFGLRRHGEAATAVLDGVRVHRLGVERHQGAGLPVYAYEYAAFFARVTIASTRAHRQRPFAVGQVASPPDLLILALLPLRLASQLPLVLDLHEALPEFFRSRFPGAANPLTLGFLALQERVAIDVADAVLTVNDALGDRLLALGVPRAKLTVLLNSPDLARFDPALYPVRPFMADGTLRLIYTGALTPIYELSVLLEALARLRDRLPGQPVQLDVFGRGDSEANLRAQCARLGLEGGVTFHGRIPIQEVPGAIARADVGLAPTRRDAFTDFSLSTKLFEYAAMGKPVIASRLPVVERYFGTGTIATYEAGDPRDLTRALLTLLGEPLEREERLRRTQARLAELGLDREIERYVALLERLRRVRGRT